MLRAAMEALSAWAVPLLLAGIPLFAITRKVNVYSAFLEGAKEGFATAVRIIPALVAVVVALGMLEASGALEGGARLLAPLLAHLSLPASVMPMLLVRPLSGSAALGVVAEVLRREGPDSYAGRLASVMAGSTETTFYVLAVYMGAVGVKRYRQALPAGLVADLVGFTASVLLVKAFFG
ncbi:MAG TPA: nucleoside recognition domain-containing protein [Anaeromyxobacteraceae bacterium]|nr:nucleoside recognition domain-containing protein [Anaeromyxobacteraceae bacterium]